MRERRGRYRVDSQRRGICPARRRLGHAGPGGRAHREGGLLQAAVCRPRRTGPTRLSLARRPAPGRAAAAAVPRACSPGRCSTSPAGDRHDHGEVRGAARADRRGVTWRGARPTRRPPPGDQRRGAAAPGPAQRADRIWANIGRVTGTIVERGRDTMLVDEGASRRRQTVRIPRAAGRLQVRFPRLQPGYLIDVIGLRHGGYLEGLIPATSQPAYPAGPPAPAAVQRPRARRASAARPPGTRPPSPADAGRRYPALDPETGCVEQPPASGRLRPDALPGRRQRAAGPQRLHRRARVLPVTGCAAVARLFNDRCVTCGHLPAGPGRRPDPWPASSPSAASWTRAASTPRSRLVPLS